MNTLSAKKKLKTRGVYEKLPLATAKRSGINMSETDKVITELKRQLKISGVKYTDVAQALSLTEGSVKRLLASGNQISLERLNAICELIDMDILNCLNLHRQRRHLLH